MKDRLKYSVFILRGTGNLLPVHVYVQLQYHNFVEKLLMLLLIIMQSASTKQGILSRDTARELVTITRIPSGR